MDSKSLRLITHQSFFSVVGSGDLESLKIIIKNDGLDLFSLLGLQNDAGETALYIAAANNFEQILSYLLGFCDLETAMIRSKADFDAFHVAAKSGHLGIVRECLAMWPGLCKVCNASNTSPLYSAAVKGHLEVVNAILDADVSSIRIVRKNGKTALHTTARYGLLDIVKTLIERDPDIISIKDKKGQTALHMAVKGQDTSVVEEMLDADSSILNERDKKGNTALLMATRKCRPQGKLDESLVDSFNVPMYFPCVEDLTKVVEKNGCFSIERIELTYPKSKLVDEADAKTLMMNLRAILEGLFVNHFGSEIANEACARTILKSDEISAWMKANYEELCQSFVALKRK